MIRFESVAVTYPDASTAAIQGIDFHVAEGELSLVIGRTGSGKSTLLGTVNGLVPHFTGGTLTGRVTVAGRDTAKFPPRELADVVGVVGQDPLSGFVTDLVEDELAYAMESIGLPTDVMRRRVEETLDLLGLSDLRHRALSTLSAGQQQRVALGSVLTAHPSVLVLDEPTSALDPTAGEEVLAALQRLVHDLGMTVLLAEHRLERVVQYADQVVHLPGPGHPIEVGTPAAVMANCAIAPPIVELGRLAGWTPLPLTVRDARRQASGLRAALRSAAPPATPVMSKSGELTAGEPVAEVRDAVAKYGNLVALRGVDLTMHEGEVVALMGRNGAGKSTLLAALTGLHRLTSGAVRIGDSDPRSLSPRELIQKVGFVPHQPADLLYASTVADECAAADGDAAVASGTCREILEALVPDVALDSHPRDLSEGQRLGLVLAIQLSAAPPLLLLDEPTRGLDYDAKARLVAILRQLAAQGHSVLLATHDVELAAQVSARTIIMAEGEIVVDGPTPEVVTSSPAFAPQVAKVLAPQRWLTVSEVARSLPAVPWPAVP